MSEVEHLLDVLGAGRGLGEQERDDECELDLLGAGHGLGKLGHEYVKAT